MTKTASNSDTIKPHWAESFHVAARPIEAPAALVTHDYTDKQGAPQRLRLLVLKEGLVAPEVVILLDKLMSQTSLA